MEMVLIVVSAIVFILSILLFQASFPNKHHQNLRRLPGPLALPIIGHLHLLRPNIHRSFHDLSSRHGPLFQLRLGSIPCIVASTPDLAEELLKTHELSFSSRKHSPAIKLLTYDVSFAFSPYGPYWKSIKKLSIYQLLGTRNLNHFQPARTTEIHRFLHHLMEKAKASETVNITEELLKLTNNVISQMMLSLRCSDTEGDAEQARDVVREVTKIFGEFDISDILGFCKSLDLQGIRKRAQSIHKKYDALLEKIISDRERAGSLKKVEMQQDQGDAEKKDFLDMLLDAMENEKSDVKLTRNHVKAIILDFFTAATDTSAIAIEWAVAELINNPRVLKKAQEEINEVVGNHRLAEESDIVHLPYIQAIIKETFRLHPPIPMISRKSVEDCTVAGYQIPANTLLFVNIWSIGRNPKYWENPLEFRPERFLGAKNGEPATRLIDVRGQHFELLPFGTGRRGCPGMALAMLELPAVLAVMLQCFDYELPSLHRSVKENAVDMDERPGLTAPRATDLTCQLKLRFDPFNMICHPSGLLP